MFLNQNAHLILIKLTEELIKFFIENYAFVIIYDVSNALAKQKNSSDANLMVFFEELELFLTATHFDPLCTKYVFPLKRSNANTLF